MYHAKLHTASLSKMSMNNLVEQLLTKHGEHSTSMVLVGVIIPGTAGRRLRPKISDTMGFP
jgi:hypothetical protein